MWSVDYQSSAVSLNVLFSADFNGDGTVDGTDLADWQTGYGSQSALHADGDADGDGDVDGKDFLIWQTQEGLSAPLNAFVQIPEPAAVFFGSLIGPIHATLIETGQVLNTV